MGHHEHRLRSPEEVPAAVLTISDTRTPETDRSGSLIRRLLKKSGHPVLHHAILPDEPALIRRALRTFGRNPRLKVVILTGGTGVSSRDRTFEVVERLLTKRLEGFGEIFRMLSYRQVGSAAFLSRALAGIYRGKAIFSLPGSPGAVKLAMEKLILPELGHLAFEITQQHSGERRRSRRTRPRRSPRPRSLRRSADL